MGREYFNAYHSYIEAMEPLNDAERGRLFTACLIYSKTGEVQELSGNERYVFPSLKSQMDRDAERYKDFTDKQSENGKKGGRPQKPKESQKTQAFLEKPKESQKTQAFFEKPKKAKEKEKEKEIYITPLTPFQGELGEAVSAWLEYKREKRQPYQPVGQKALFTEIANRVKAHGEAFVIAAITGSMAANYQGIAWDKGAVTASVPQSAVHKSNRPIAPLGDAERAAMDRMISKRNTKTEDDTS